VRVGFGTKEDLGGIALVNVLQVVSQINQTVCAPTLLQSTAVWSYHHPLTCEEADFRSGQLVVGYLQHGQMLPLARLRHRPVHDSVARQQEALAGTVSMQRKAVNTCVFKQLAH
jgi:hypothetical protein